MSVCDEPAYTCPAFGTKPQLKATSDKRTHIHNENRVFTLSTDTTSIVINSRTRSHTYSSEETWELRDGRVVLGIDNSEIDCGTVVTTEGSSLKESYTAVDCTFLYADLRYDCFIYQEVASSLTWDITSDKRIPISDSGGNIYLYPYVDNEVPIIRTTKIICTSLADKVLYESSVDTIYVEGVRLLMPTYDGKLPRHTPFISKGILYPDAYAIDWYNQFENWVTDGDLFLWWPDWLRSIVKNKALDIAEATMLYDSYNGLSTPANITSSSGVVSKTFYGSCAFDKYQNIFLSASLENGQLVVSKLLVQGIDTPIPKNKEVDVWYPIAPM